MLRGGQDSGIASFKGIPYAAPPTGSLRWRPPVPATAWAGVRNARSFGPACSQPKGFSGVDQTAGGQSEDCLTLNVWTQQDFRNQKRPVMVWIHGGAFVGGASSAPFYNGTSFARDGIVFVSINYRMGRLGYFAHPALLRESGPHGNYGLMDQIAALQWVQQNVAQFGGDPGNVTLFGESSGGASVNMLMIAPQARGLFQRAISQAISLGLIA